MASKIAFLPAIFSDDLHGLGGLPMHCVKKATSQPQAATYMGEYRSCSVRGGGVKKKEVEFHSANLCYQPCVSAPTFTACHELFGVPEVP